jgi:hypothetical protein
VSVPFVPDYVPNAAHLNPKPGRVDLFFCTRRSPFCGSVLASGVAVLFWLFPRSCSSLRGTAFVGT